MGEIRRLCGFLVVLSIASAAAHARAQDIRPVSSLRELTTGNGHGFQVYDSTTSRITGFLERPYMFTQPGSRPEDGGRIRRDLGWDIYFGLRVSGRAIWLPEAETDRPVYLEQSNIIKATHHWEGVTAHSLFFAPFGFEGNAMVALLQVEGDGSEVSAFVLQNFHMGTGRPDPSSGDETIEPGTSGSQVETGPGGGALIYLPIGGLSSTSCSISSYSEVIAGGDLDGIRACEGDDKVNFFQRDLGPVASGESAWWGLVVLYVPDPTEVGAMVARWEAFLDGRSPEILLDDALDEWEAWRRPIPIDLNEEERLIWRQSEAVLRMAQIREPVAVDRRSFGMILASLPPGGWHSGFSREAIYAIVALARSGHYQEARDGLEFFLRSEAGLGAEHIPGVDDYCVAMMRYFGDGTEELFYNSEVQPAIDLASWGLYLWAARSYIAESGDVTWLSSADPSGERVYDRIRSCVAEPLSSTLETSGLIMPDNTFSYTSDRQHRLFTTAAAGRGFCDMAALAEMVDRPEDASEFAALHRQIASAIPERFIGEAGALECSSEAVAVSGECSQGTAVEVINWGLIGATSDLGLATLDFYDRRLRTILGGWSFNGSPDPFGSSEWVFLDLRAASALRAAGQVERADWRACRGSVSGQLQSDA